MAAITPPTERNAPTLSKKRRKVYCSEELKKLNRDDLEEYTQQITAHNTQLQSLLRKTLEEQSSVAATKRNNKNKNDRPFDFSKHPKRHVLLKFAYLGWDYDGYAVQEDTLNTIENVLFDALMRVKLLPDRETANYHRCGRTDKGVSAFSQVVSLTLRSRVSTTDGCKQDDDEIDYVDMLNRVLPKEVRMLAWAPVTAGFSARFNCSSRTYKYFFPKGSLNLQRMQEAGRLLEGSHDFRNLCKMDVGNGVVTFRRTVDSVAISLLSDECSVIQQLSATGTENYNVADGTGIAKGETITNSNIISICDKNNVGLGKVPDDIRSTEEMNDDTNNLTVNSLFNGTNNSAKHILEETSITTDHSTSSNLKEFIPPSQNQSINLETKQIYNIDGKSAAQGDNKTTLFTKEKGIEMVALATNDNRLPPYTRKNEYSDNNKLPPSTRSEEFSDGNELCVATITSKAFLWHQIRAIMAVLVLVGEGKEEPSVIAQLLDIENNPGRPQYSLASQVPLCLFFTEYPSEDVDWRYCPQSLEKVQTDLQNLWAQHAIRGGMIQRMLTEVSLMRHGGSREQKHEAVDHHHLPQQLLRQHYCLSPASQPRIYRPLFKRKTCASLETRIEQYSKRRRWRATDDHTGDQNS